MTRSGFFLLDSVGGLVGTSSWAGDSGPEFGGEEFFT